MVSERFQNMRSSIRSSIVCTGESSILVVSGTFGKCFQFWKFSGCEHFYVTLTTCTNATDSDGTSWNSQRSPPSSLFHSTGWAAWCFLCPDLFRELIRSSLILSRGLKRHIFGTKLHVRRYVCENEHGLIAWFFSARRYFECFYRSLHTVGLITHTVDQFMTNEDIIMTLTATIFGYILKIYVLAELLIFIRILFSSTSMVGCMAWF